MQRLIKKIKASFDFLESQEVKEFETITGDLIYFARVAAVCDLGNEEFTHEFGTSSVKTSRNKRYEIDEWGMQNQNTEVVTMLPNEILNDLLNN